MRLPCIKIDKKPTVGRSEKSLNALIKKNEQVFNQLILEITRLRVLLERQEEKVMDCINKKKRLLEKKRLLSADDKIALLSTEHN